MPSTSLLQPTRVFDRDITLLGRFFEAFLTEDWPTLTRESSALRSDAFAQGSMLNDKARHRLDMLEDFLSAWEALDAAPQAAEVVADFFAVPFEAGHWAWNKRVAAIGALGGVLAAFHESLTALGGVSLDPDELVEIEGLLADESDACEAFLGTVQAAVRTRDVDGLRGTCEAAYLRQEGSWSALGHWAALAHRLSEQAREQGRVGDAREALSLSLLIGEASRGQIWCLLAALHGIELSGRAGDDNLWDDHVAAARSLPFESAVEDGRNVTLSALLADPDSDMGDLVEFEGVVTASRVFREGTDKVTSIFTVSDVGNNAKSVEVSIGYRNILREGLTDGSPVRVNGTPYLGRDGTLRVRLDRVAHARLATESWIDFLTKLLNPSFMRTTGGHNLHLGIAPKGEGSLPTFGAELVELGLDI
jgi:hypothetical protein